MSASDAYTQLITLLDQQGVQYRLIDHAPEGRTEIVSPMRRNELRQAAKCIILMVKIGKKVTKYVLGVVPGDARMDLNAVKTLMGATYVSQQSGIGNQFELRIKSKGQNGSGHAARELFRDARWGKGNEEIYFNAARLDRSIALKTSDYAALAKPRLARIANVRKIESAEV